MDSNQELFKCGVIAKSMGGASSEYTKMEGLRGKARLIACGK